MTDTNPIFQEIQTIITENSVALFMKGTPQMPNCGFSNFAVQVLQKLKVEFVGVNVLESEEIRQGIKDFTNWPTIPQLYIGGEFVGGADIIRDMYKSGELLSLLTEKGISHQLPEA